MKYDVIIIGGGPGGSQCGIECAKKGLDVIIFEKERPGRYKPCGGGLTYKNEMDFGKIPNNLVERNLDYLVFGGKKEEARIDFKDFNFGKLVYRNKFDLYLQEEAIRNGVKIQYESEISSINRKRDFIEVEIKNILERVKAETIVVATGAKQCKLLSNFSNLDSIKDFVFTIQGEYYLPEHIINERFGGGSWNLYFDSNLIGEHGYAWIFTKREGLTVGYLEKKVNKTKFNEIITKHPLISEKMKGSKPIKIEGKHLWGAPIADRMSEYQYDDRILVIGEATGIIDRFYYEGIWQARKSGQIAAETLVKAKKKNDYLRWQLKGYETNLRKKVYLKESVGIYESRDRHHFYYHSGFLDEFVESVIRILKDEVFMNELMKMALEQGIIDIFTSETLQVKILDNLEKTTERKKFNAMFKELKRIIIN